MNPIEIINKFYPQETEQRHTLLIRSLSVVQKALKVVDAHPNLSINHSFVKEATPLHDIGILLTDALTIQYFEEHLYITCGHLGADLLRKGGFERHTLVCERHAGTGLTLEEIIERQLPIPHCEMVPVILEEQIICLTGKFFSRTHLGGEKTVGKVRKSTAKYSEEGLNHFDGWRPLFL